MTDLRQTSTNASTVYLYTSSTYKEYGKMYVENGSSSNPTHSASEKTLIIDTNRKAYIALDVKVNTHNTYAFKYRRIGSNS